MVKEDKVKEGDNEAYNSIIDFDGAPEEVIELNKKKEEERKKKKEIEEGTKKLREERKRYIRENKKR